MFKKRKHKPGRWLGVSATLMMAMSLMGPVYTPVYAAGDTDSSDATAIQTSYVGFSAVSDIKVNNVSVAQYFNYTVRFDLNGADGSVPAISMTSDKTGTMPDAPARTGYDFEGWSTAKKDPHAENVDYGAEYSAGEKFGKDQKTDHLTDKDGDTITLYAVWKPHTYTVKFVSGMDGSSGTMADQKFVYDETNVLHNNTFTKTGYQMLHWETGDGKTYENMASVLNLAGSKNNDSVTLTGVWTEAQPADKVHINADVHSVHSWVSKYDDTYHWEECSICHQIRNKAKHNYVNSYWTQGDWTNCSYTNVYRRICNCGYSHDSLTDDAGHTKAAHNFREADGSISYGVNANYHCYHCTVCGQNSDWFTYAEFPEHDTYWTEPHKDAQGNILGDTTGRSGTCAICGAVITQPSHVSFGSILDENGENLNQLDGIDTDAYKARAGVCRNGDGFKAWDLEKTTYTVKRSNGIVTADVNLYSIHPIDQSKVSGANVTISYEAGAHELNTSRYSLNPASSFKVQDAHHVLWHMVWNDNGKEDASVISSKFTIINPIQFTDGSLPLTGQMGFTIYPEYNKPAITDFSETENDIKSGWTTGLSLHVKGTEDSGSSVHVKIYDKDKVYENDTVNFSKDASGKYIMDNGSYVYEHTIYPDISASDAKTLTVEVTDKWGNRSMKTLSVNKVDTAAPTLVDKIDYSGQWAKTRKFTVKATDGTGSGNVKIGINDLKDMTLGTKSGSNYTKEYSFAGDKYDDDKYLVILEDSVGNRRTEAIDIGYIDNTNPTISKTDINGLIVKVNANDINPSITDGTHPDGMEGSGVVKYGYLNITKDKDFKWTDSDTLNLPESGTYLIAVQDKVGNISTPERVVVKGTASRAKKTPAVTYFDAEW